MMKKKFLLFILVLVSWCSAQQCVDKYDEPEPGVMSGKILPAMTVLLSYPAGVGPGLSLGISVVMTLLNKVFPSPDDGKLAYFDKRLNDAVYQLGREIDEGINTSISAGFSVYVGRVKFWMGVYKNRYNDWNTASRPKTNATSVHYLEDFYQDKTLQIGAEIAGLTGPDNPVPHLALPMVAMMGMVQLSIYNDAIFIGNGDLGMNAAERPTNFTNKYQEALGNYTKFLLTTYDNKINEYHKKLDATTDVAKFNDILNDQLAFERAIVLNVFDVAAKWSMTIPSEDKEIIPVDIVFTRPIYSKATECTVNVNRCKTSYKALDRIRNTDPQYRSLAKQIQWALTFHQGQGYQYGSPQYLEVLQEFLIKYDDNTEFRNQPNKEFRYSVLQSMDAKQNITVSYTGVNDNFNNDYSSGITCSGKCTMYSSIFQIGKVSTKADGIHVSCPKKTQTIETPLGHGISRFIPAQEPDSKSEINSWAIEYRKYNNRLDFSGINSSHALRFPGEYLMYKSSNKDGIKLGDMNYLMGGRGIDITKSIQFTLPSLNSNKFVYDLRVYTNASSPSITINNCVLKKRLISFGGMNLYDGNCQFAITTKSVLIQGPLYLGAIEIVQVKAKSGFGESCVTNSSCQSGLSCYDSVKRKICLKFPASLDQCKQRYVVGKSRRPTPNITYVNEWMPTQAPEQCRYGYAISTPKDGTCQLLCGPECFLGTCVK